MTLGQRLHRLMRSFLGLPLWVQVWMTVLIGTNLAAFWMLDTAVGFWTAVALVVMMAFNGPMMVIQAGMTRLLSIPHFVWLPLAVYILYRLFGPEPIDRDSAEFGYAVAVFAVNGISLAFDVYESYRWLRGDREVLGVEA